MHELEYTNEKDAISRITDTFNKAKSILESFKKEYGGESSEFKEIEKEYQEASHVYENSKNNDLHISKEEWVKILKELNDIMLVGKKHRKGDEFQIDELNIHKLGFLKYNTEGKFQGGDKKQIDMFLNSSLSISSLTPGQIGKLLSGVYDLGENYINRFVTRFTTDEQGLDYLIKKWQPGKTSIDRYLIGVEGQNIIGSKIKNSIIDKIIESLDSKIRNLLVQSFRKKHKNKSPEEINSMVDGVLNKIKKEKESEYVFQILHNALGEENTEIALNLSQEEIRKRELEVIKSGKDENGGAKNLSQSKERLQNILNVRNKQTEGDKQIFDKSLAKISQSKERLSTSMILVKTISDLETNGNNKALVLSLKKSFSEEIKIGNKEIKDNGQKNTRDEKIKNESSNEKSISYANGSTITYNEVGTGYGVNTDNGVIEINYKELQIIKKSEKALENMIHFKDTLEELNLGGLWKYREYIFQALANKYTLAFNTKDDYLNENELKIFLTAILQSIGSPANNVNNFEDLKGKIKALNYGGVITGQKDVNKSGDSLIESIFIQKFDPKRSGMFELNAFQKSISNLFGKSM